jgi:hypothetical protein
LLIFEAPLCSGGGGDEQQILNLYCTCSHILSAIVSLSLSHTQKGDDLWAEKDALSSFHTHTHTYIICPIILSLEGGVGLEEGLCYTIMSQNDVKKRKLNKGEDPVVTLRFMDRKYRVPASALSRISFFKGFLGYGPMNGTTPLEDGSYFIPELASGDFEHLLVHVGGLKHADPLMYHPDMIATTLPPFSETCDQICAWFLGEFTPKNQNKWHMTGSPSHNSRKYQQIIPNVIFVDKQQGNPNGLRIVHDNMDRKLMIIENVTSSNADYGIKMRLSDRVTNEHPLVATKVATITTINRYNSTKPDKMLVEVRVTLAPNNTFVIISEIKDESSAGKDTQ